MTICYPAVLTLSGHDPSGGAGLQADIEALASHRCHAVSVITCLTEQDSRNVINVIPQAPENILSQATTLLSDISVKAIKIGLLGHPDLVEPIHTILKRHPNIPVIFDPVLSAGGGTDLATARLIALINELLLPSITVLTPNSVEARRLTGLDDLDECGSALLNRGCEYVLVTGTHENSQEVTNRLFYNESSLKTYSWNRLPHSYHGSGCTLAASIAGLIAQGLDVCDAVREAQEYTWSTLAHGYLPGKGQYIPNRLFWVEDE